VPVLGISVRAPKAKQEENVWNLASRTLALLGVPGELPREAVVANSDYVGDGYGLPTESMLEALTLLPAMKAFFSTRSIPGKGLPGLST
jgi:L-cysteate sulfo-lyase